MVYQQVFIKTDPTLPTGSCTLSEDLIMSGLRLRNRQLTIMAGNRQITAQAFRDREAPRSTITFSPDLGALLCLPKFELRLNARMEGRALRIGPFIGIYGYRRPTGRIFDEQTSYFRKLCQAAGRQCALAYVLSPEDFEFEAGYTKGYLFVENGAEPGQWVRTALPLPDVFYDRGLFPKGPGKAKSMKIRRFLRSAWGNKFFNPKFFDKWRTHRWISMNEDLKKYLPETIKTDQPGEIREMLEKFGSIYLKPSGGSSGRGIIRVRNHSGKVLAEFFRKRQSHTLTYGSVKELWNSLWQKGMLNKTFIVQQDLNLAHYQSRPFDIRALMQKDSSGQWVLTGMAARVAGANSITTNLHAGGTAMKIDSVLRNIFGDKKAKILDTQLKALCFSSCQWVEQLNNLKYGEIAVDIGVSKDGKPWLIEMNAVPGRTIFSKINEPLLRLKAIKRPIEYALFLAGFGTEIKEEQELI